MFLEMMTNMRRNVIYSMFMFQPALKFSELAYNGFWFSPEMEFLLHSIKKRALPTAHTHCPAHPPHP